MHFNTVYTLTDGLDDYTEVWGKMMSFLQGNQFLMVFLVGSLVAMVWKHFGAAKRSVR